ncbi:hypothetical protein LEP1GSC047_3603 [Leptospira inadai serovar Lyme str. 10]|uniref:Uncharacterized protein n=1 Tax=Leptospira inadai serovar Lyme str. 10 TaxID=1049790 RepID=V6HEY9_9LEPT|nr:hypothetical protein LEP1GSC047_3603 [Leptospira inadai serovar Lyme str. 10]
MEPGYEPISQDEILHYVPFRGQRPEDRRVRFQRTEDGGQMHSLRSR